MSIPRAAPVRRAAGAFTGVNAYGFPILRNCPRVERGGQRGRNISHRTSRPIRKNSRRPSSVRLASAHQTGPTAEDADWADAADFADDVRTKSGRAPRAQFNAFWGSAKPEGVHQCPPKNPPSPPDSQNPRPPVRGARVGGPDRLPQPKVGSDAAGVLAPRALGNSPMSLDFRVWRNGPRRSQ